MSKPLMVGLVLASLLTGCHAPVVLQAAPVEVERTLTGNSAKRVMPAGTPLVGPKANVGIKPNMTPRSGAPMISTSATSALTADAGSLSAGGAAAQAPRLKVTESPTESIKLVPILGDDRQVASVMTQPATGELVWRLQTLGAPFQLGKVRITLQSKAHYPDPNAEAPGGPDAPPALPSYTPIDEPGEPTTIDLSPQEAKLPATWALNAQQAVTIDLKSTLASRLLAENPLTARASIAVTFLDADDQPLRGDGAEPLTLTATVTVL